MMRLLVLRRGGTRYFGVRGGTLCEGIEGGSGMHDAVCLLFYD